MSSSGLAKWQKYFSLGDIETEVSGNKPVSTFDENGRFIEKIAPGTKITVLQTPRYFPKYKVLCNSRIVYIPGKWIEKPKNTSGATERLGIRAETLVKTGEHTYYGNTLFYSFSNSNNLSSSILSSLVQNKKIRPQVLGVIRDYCGSDFSNINWANTVFDFEKNELGKYLGELIPGLLLLSGNKQPFTREFFNDDISSFNVPADPSYSGIDSFIISTRQQKILLSSKYGAGAKASFFPNILAKSFSGFLGTSNLSYYSSIYSIAKELGITKEILETKSGGRNREIIYNVGLKKVLDLDLENPYNVYLDIKSGKLSGNTEIVLDKIAEKANTFIKESLPFSTTNYFCRTIAASLMEDESSMEEMKDILTSKDFFQLNLHIPEWKRGRVRYKVLHSSDINLKIIGNKSSMTDITARQGLLNYQLSVKEDV